MVLVAEVTTPAETLAVGRALRVDAPLTVELERVVPTREQALPFFWAWGEPREEFEATLRDDPAVDDLTRLDTTEDGGFYRIAWNGDAGPLLREFVALDLSLARGVGTADRWHFELRFPDGDAAGAFQTRLRGLDVPYRLERLYGLSSAHNGTAYGLTPEQREMLVVAQRNGYFEEPRAVTQRDLADRFGISASAVAGRLRRGTDGLVRNTLLRNSERPPP